MTFTKSPHQLTHAYTVRVPAELPGQLKIAATRAGVPHGALIARLVSQYLAASDVDSTELVRAQLREAAAVHYRQLGEALGLIPGEDPVEAARENPVEVRSADFWSEGA